MKNKFKLFIFILITLGISYFIFNQISYKNDKYIENINFEIPEIYNILKNGEYNLIIKNTGDKTIKSFGIKITLLNIYGNVIDETKFYLEKDKLLAGDSKVYSISFDNIGISLKSVPTKFDVELIEHIYIKR